MNTFVYSTQTKKSIVMKHFSSLPVMRYTCAKHLSEVGFEPTPTYVDQKSLHLLTVYAGKAVNLESGALDHSAILTVEAVMGQNS